MADRIARELSLATALVALAICSAMAQVRLGPPIDGAEGDARIGFAVSLSRDGSRLAVGSPESDLAGENAGAVQVYAYDGNVWAPLGAVLTGDSSGLNFGRTVALSADGSRLAVGADGADLPRPQRNGSVRAFAFDGESWGALGQPVYGPGSSESYGFQLGFSADGTHFVTGLRPRVFAFDGGAWSAVGEPLTPLSALGASFALPAPAISGDGATVVVANPLFDASPDEGESRTGAVSTFTREGGSYRRVDSLVNNFTDALYGYAVALADDASHLVVGSLPSRGAGGEVAFYARDGDGWVAVGPAVVRFGELWGSAIDISADGTRAVSGAPDEDPERGTSVTGTLSQAYVLDDDAFRPLGTPLFGDGLDVAGFAVALSGDGQRAAIGAPNHLDGQVGIVGRVRVWDLRDASTTSVPGFPLESHSLAVFPNPTRGRVTVTGLPADPRGAHLTDLAGRPVGGVASATLLAQLRGGRLDLGELPAGIYVLSAWSEDAIWQGRVVRMRP